MPVHHWVKGPTSISHLPASGELTICTHPKHGQAGRQVDCRLPDTHWETVRDATVSNRSKSMRPQERPAITQCGARLTAVRSPCERYSLRLDAGSLTTTPQRLRSSFINVAKSAGVPPATSALWSMSLLRMSAIPRILTNSPLRRRTTAVGVAAGTTVPYHNDMSMRSLPSPAKVGTSGSKRWRSLTPIFFMRRPFSFGFQRSRPPFPAEFAPRDEKGPALRGADHRSGYLTKPLWSASPICVSGPLRPARKNAGHVHRDRRTESAPAVLWGSRRSPGELPPFDQSFPPEVLTDPLAIQFPVFPDRIRNTTLEGVQVPSTTIVPENWASPVELSGTETVFVTIAVVGVPTVM